jgi:hypothetical protein
VLSAHNDTSLRSELRDLVADVRAGLTRSNDEDSFSSEWLRVPVLFRMNDGALETLLTLELRKARPGVGASADTYVVKSIGNRLRVRIFCAALAVPRVGRAPPSRQDSDKPFASLRAFADCLHFGEKAHVLKKVKLLGKVQKVVKVPATYTDVSNRAYGGHQARVYSLLGRPKHRPVLFAIGIMREGSKQAGCGEDSVLIRLHVHTTDDGQRFVASDLRHVMHWNTC